MFRTIWRATWLIAFVNAAALGLQFLTTILMARTFGASASMDAYTLAVSIPESLQYLLMLATLTVVFTPLFIQARTRHGASEAWSMAMSLLLLVVVLVLIAIPILAWAMPWLMGLLAPGFAPATRALAVELSNLILPGLIYYATAGILLGICYAYHDFTTAALNTLLLALLNLAAYLVFVQLLQWGVSGMMMGRLLALAAMQIFLVVRALRHKKNIPAPLRVLHPRVRQMFTYLPPYMFGAVSGQVALIVNRSLITTLGAGSVAAWSYGQRIADIPMAVLGAAFGATYLPDFAAYIAAQNLQAANEQWQRAALRVVLLLSPVAALLLALAVPLIAVLFQRGAFDATATQESALVLAGLAIGLPLRGIGGLVVRGLPAFHTRRVPLILSAVASGASIACAFAFLNVWGLFGVALAVSIGDALFAIGGAIYFWRRMRSDERAALLALAKIFAVSVLAGSASYLCAQLLQSFPYVLQVLVGGGVGVLLFFAGALLFRLPETGAVVKILRASIG